MSSHKDFKHESQDARRHDQQHAIHPEGKHRSDEKSEHKSVMQDHSKRRKKK